MAASGRIREFFEEKVQEYEQPAFIADDPVCIPHLFTRPQDIEIAGFFAAMFSWGRRTAIIQKSRELMQRMDMQPYEFVLHAGPDDLRRLDGFCYRTFNTDDLYYFLEFLRGHYGRHPSLEQAFTCGMQPGDATTENALTGFQRYFFEGEHLARTRKHISTPARASACKRLNMYLRWMVRSPKHGVDFGLWKGITPAQLVCPLDVHVARVARRFQLLTRSTTDWQAALELTACLRRWDKQDPVKYDFALFALGVIEKY